MMMKKKKMTPRLLSQYFKNQIWPYLPLTSRYQTQKIKRVSSGTISEVFFVQINNHRFFVKHVIPGHLAKASKDMPDEIKILHADDRQLYEVKALKMLENILGKGVVPHVYYHGTKNNILVISDVAGKNGQLLEKIIKKEINITVAKRLAKIAAQVSNGTYRKIKPLRSKTRDQKIKFLKLKYNCRDVYQKIDPRYKSEVKRKVNRFINESMKENIVLVNGDYRPRNIICRGNKLSFFDLEIAHLGDPALDIGTLVARYLLVAEYYKRVRYRAVKATIEILKTFLKDLNIPINKIDLENRIKKVIAGIMLMEIDSIGQTWTKWFKRESARKSVREHAVQLVLDEDLSITDLIKKIYTV